MKSAIALAALFVAASCAQQPVQVAQNECKVVPITTASVAGGKTRPASSLEQRHAEAQLATSQYRMAQLNSHGMFHNNVEEALRDCRR